MHGAIFNHFCHNLREGVFSQRGTYTEQLEGKHYSVALVLKLILFYHTKYK